MTGENDSLFDNNLLKLVLVIIFTLIALVTCLYTRNFIYVTKTSIKETKTYDYEIIEVTKSVVGNYLNVTYLDNEHLKSKWLDYDSIKCTEAEAKANIFQVKERTIDVYSRLFLNADIDENYTKLMEKTEYEYELPKEVVRNLQ